MSRNNPRRQWTNKQVFIGESQIQACSRKSRIYLFHGEYRGSNPRGDANKNKEIRRQVRRFSRLDPTIDPTIGVGIAESGRPGVGALNAFPKTVTPACRLLHQAEQSFARSSAQTCATADVGSPVLRRDRALLAVLAHQQILQHRHRQQQRRQCEAGDDNRVGPRKFVAKLAVPYERTVQIVVYPSGGDDAVWIV